ncbi:MAG: putative zinc-binding protein [Chloroflexi bacterium]|nr:putative zinc-binding protein [Chloroflexota bacterium]
MVNLPARKVGIISCSGEELAEGTVSRMATRLVLEKLRPGQTVTLCLPLFLAGGKEERAFAKFYPTIAVDGCDKLCAAKATEAYSARPAAVVDVSKVAARFPELKAESRRHLGEGGMELARRVAEEIATRVDEILGRQAGPGVIRLDGAGSGAVVHVDAASLRRRPTTTGCSCGVDGLPVKTIRVGDGLVGIAGLEPIFEQVLSSSGQAADSELKEELLRVVKVYNYIAPGREAAYADALWAEFVAYRTNGRPGR